MAANLLHAEIARVTARIIEHIGADYFVWASDYPHIDASFGVVGEIRSRISSLSIEDQAKLLGLNALKFYGLEAAYATA